MEPSTLVAAATAFTIGLSAGGLSLAQAQSAPRQQQSQEGEASYYGREFNGRPMANGERFNPQSDSAAHRNLPLGTTARVTNLQNGRSSTVRVEDRGPYARNRVIDVSPRTADELGMKQAGRAPVRVTPIEVPQRNERPGRAEGRQARR